MVVNLNAVKELLLKELPDADIKIYDSVGDGNHFEATIVSNKFVNKTNIQRHKMVYDALGSIVGNEMHALSLDTKTFSENTSNNPNTKNDTLNTIDNIVDDSNFMHSYNNSTNETSNDVLKKIDEVVKNYPVVLFMKGTKASPMCGFSSVVCQILLSLGVEFEDINVLSSEEIRENIKIYSQWATIPQLYIKGVFIGGCYIVRGMFEDNSLQELLKKHNLLA